MLASLIPSLRALATLILLLAPSAIHAQRGSSLPLAAAHATDAPSLLTDSLEVARTVARFHQALADGDSVGALALLADDALILESGSSESRAEYRAHHLAADIAFAREVPRERTPVRVRVEGDVAWATSTGTATGRYRGRAVNSATAELMVLSRTGGGWRIRAIHWSSRTVRPPQ